MYQVKCVGYFAHEHNRRSKKEPLKTRGDKSEQYNTNCANIHTQWLGQEPIQSSILPIDAVVLSILLTKIFSKI